MKIRAITILLLIGGFLLAGLLSGCTVAFTSSDALQINITKPSENTVSLISEFEAGESESNAGDATQQAGSVCTGGACIIY